MENVSHSSKTVHNGNKFKSTYDDVVFVSPARPKKLSPRVEDYAEIFGGFHSTRASSIPVLDLPTTPFHAPVLSSFEYSDVFGGFKDPDFALSYDELVRIMMRMGDGQSNGPDALSSPDADDSWTMSGSDYLSEESNVKNQCLSNGDSCESVDGEMEFSISYNKAGQRSNGTLSNGITQMHVVPEYSFAVDRGNSSSKTSGDCQPFEVGNGHLNAGVSGELQTGKLFKKTLSQPAYGATQESSHSNQLKPHKEYNRSVSFPNEMFLTVSAVSLRTQPSNLPPPSRPPPSLDVGNMDSGKLSSITDSLGFEGEASNSSLPYFDVEVDVDSSAAASVAAMKEAMEKAQAKLKSAKESLPKRKEGNKSSKKLGSKKNGKCKGEKLDQSFDSSGTRDEEFQSTSGGQETRVEFPLFQEQHKVAHTAQSIPNSLEGKIHLDLTKKSAADKHGIESVSSWGSAEIDRAGEWQEATQYYELVKLDKLRKPFGQTKNDKVWMQSINIHEFEKKGKKATVEGLELNDIFMGTLQSKSLVGNNVRCEAVNVLNRHKELENMHTVDNASRWDEDGKKSGVNLQAADTENEQARANNLQSENFDGLLHINNWTELKQTVKQKEGELQQREADSCMKGGTEETQRCLGVVDDDETIEALELVENARRQRQAFEEEEKISYEKKQDAFEREEKEKRYGEALKFEESEGQDEVLGKELNNRKFEVTKQDEGSEKKWNEAVEREENEKREKEVQARKEREKKLKETVEREKERRKRETVDQEESEKRQRDAREREKNEKRLEAALETEKNEGRVKDAAAREENEKRQKESCGAEEMEEMLRVAAKQGDTEKSLEVAHEQEENDNKKKEAPEKEGTEKRHEELSEKEEVKRRIKGLGSKEIGNRSDDANEKEGSSKSLTGAKEGDYEIGVKEACEQQEARNITQQYHKQKDVGGNDATLKGPCARGLNPGAMCSDIKLDSINNHSGTQLKAQSLSNGNFETVSGKQESIKRPTEIRGGERDVASGMVDEICCGKTIFRGMVQGNMEDKANELPLEDTVGLSYVAGDVKKAGEGEIAIEQQNIEEIIVASPLDFDEKKAEHEWNEKISHESNERGKNSENAQVFSSHGDIRDIFLSARVVKERDDIGKKKEVPHLAKLEVKKSSQITAQHASPRQVDVQKVKNLKATMSSGERESEMMIRGKKLEQERWRKLEEEREREREREKDRMAVDGPKFEGRGFTESRDRLERAAVERMMNEARERLEKACAEAREKSLTDKTPMEARLRAERAAVERATAEARERAFQKAMAERTSFEMKDRVEGSTDHSSASSRTGVKPSSSSYDQQDMLSPNAGLLGSLRSQNSSHHSDGPYIVERSGVVGESPQRGKARLERHRRTAERAAKALAEKNMRDLLAQREQAERNRLAETLDADVRRWLAGKEGNLRALLSTLQYILGPDSGWQPVPLTDVVTAAAVKKAYRKATLCVHPDKLQQRGASIQQKYICEKVFDLLKEAWNRFNSEER